MVEIVMAERGNAMLLERAAHVVFDNPVRPDLLVPFLEDPRRHLALAVDEDVAVGMASAIECLHPDNDVEAWINEVGVAPAFRDEGVATALLEALFDRLRSRGVASVWVATEADNDAARALYRKVGAEQTEGLVMYAIELD